jgi:hypothetical protein
MGWKLKLLCSTLFAVIAMGAAAVPAAMSHQFTAEVASVQLEGFETNEQVLVTNTGAALRCKEAMLQGPQLGATSVDQVNLSPSYSSCTFGGNPATVTATDCAYVLDSDTDAGGDAPVHIVCTGNAIKVDTAVCDLTIDSQTPGGGVSFKNEGSGTSADVVITFTMTGITFSKHGTALGCSFAGSSGTYNGSITLKGYRSLPSGPEQRGISVD